MSKSVAYRRKNPRAQTELVIQCMAEPRLFLDWDKMTPKERDEFKQHGSIPCDGGGRPGEWCFGCRFMKLASDETEVLRRAGGIK